MSSKRPIAEIAPEGFLERYDADTYETALRCAEQQPSTTPRDRMPRCPNPECTSVRISRKAGVDMSHAVESDYVCTRCREHFNEKMPPEAVVEAELTVALRLNDETERCCACGERARVFVYDSELGVAGTVCFDHVGDMLARELGGGDDE